MWAGHGDPPAAASAGHTRLRAQRFCCNSHCSKHARRWLTRAPVFKQAVAQASPAPGACVVRSHSQMERGELVSYRRQCRRWSRGKGHEPCASGRAGCVPAGAYPPVLAECSPPLSAQALGSPLRKTFDTEASHPGPKRGVTFRTPLRHRWPHPHPPRPRSNPNGVSLPFRRLVHPSNAQKWC